MKLYSKNLLMSKTAEQYEVLESLKVNPKCFFILDETEFSTWDYSAEMTVQIDEDIAPSSSLFIYGSTSSGTAISVECLYPTYNNFYFISGNKGALGLGFGLNMLLNPVIERTSETSSTVTSYRDGNRIWWGNITSDFVPSKGEFSLFGSSDTNSIFKGLFYNFTLTIEGETVYDLVPARKIADGELGLLNKVDGKFYENQGTGTLERGEENA